MPLRAVTLDYWDTIYSARAPDEGNPRLTRRSHAMRELVASLGHELTDDEWHALYAASGREAERWWREEHRGYTAADRITWALGHLGLACEASDPRFVAVVRAVDDALLAHPPALLPGAAEGVRALRAAGLRLAIVSDTGFPSGEAQTEVLARDGLADAFDALVYSCDVGHTKPNAAMFQAALDRLGVAPDETLHVGDIERTDVAGALAMGMRAVRIDVMRDSGPSAAELVARSWAAIVAHVLSACATTDVRGA